MKKVLFATAILFLATLPAFGQSTTTTPTTADLGFSSASITASALVIHGNGATVPVSDLSEALAITNTASGTGNLSFRMDELLTSSNNNFTAYQAGLKYFIPPIKALSSTNLAPLQLYVSGEGGITRTTLTGATNPTNSPSARALFGLNWNPTTTGSASFNIAEIGYLYAPNLVQGHNHFFTLSAGVKLSF